MWKINDRHNLIYDMAQLFLRIDSKCLLQLIVCILSQNIGFYVGYDTPGLHLIRFQHFLLVQFHLAVQHLGVGLQFSCQ